MCIFFGNSASILQYIYGPVFHRLVGSYRKRIGINSIMWNPVLHRILKKVNEN